MQALFALFIEQLGDAAVFFGILVAEAQIFELPFELPHAQAVGQRRENIQRFFGGGAFFRAVGHAAEKLHGAGAQRQRNQHHADVRHHCQQHLAHGFGLCRALFGRSQRIDAGKVGELAHFVDAAHQRAHRFAAGFGQRFFPLRPVARHIGQHRCRHRIGQQIHLRRRIRCRQKVCEQGFAERSLRVGRIMGIRRRQSRQQAAFVVFRLPCGVVQIGLAEGFVFGCGAHGGIPWRVTGSLKTSRQPEKRSV